MSLTEFFTKLFKLCVFHRFNPFTPKFLKWPLPALKLDKSIVANGDASQKPKTKLQTVKLLKRLLIMSCLSSWSTLFAKVSILVSGSERLNENSVWLPQNNLYLMYLTLAMLNKLRCHTHF